MTARKPGHTLFQSKRSTRNQARVWKSIVIPKIANTPAAAPTTAPLVSFVILPVISVLASSISSRTRSEAFSETSFTISPRLLSAGPPLPGALLTGDPPQDQGERQPARERRADE